MGMYTALYGSITLKPFVEDTLRLSNGIPPGWVRWEWLKTHRGLKNHPDVKALLKTPHYDWIASGGSSYFDDEYEESYWQEILSICGDGHAVYRPKTKELYFHGSLKNSDGEIQAFIRILPLISTHWDLQSIYEEHKWEYHPDQHASVVSHGRVVNDFRDGEPITRKRYCGGVATKALFESPLLELERRFRINVLLDSCI